MAAESRVETKGELSVVSSEFTNKKVQTSNIRLNVHVEQMSGWSPLLKC